MTTPFVILLLVNSAFFLLVYRKLQTMQALIDFINNTLTPLVSQIDTNVKALKTAQDLTPVQDTLNGLQTALQGVVTDSTPA